MTESWVSLKEDDLVCLKDCPMAESLVCLKEMTLLVQTVQNLVLWMD